MKLRQPSLRRFFLVRSFLAIAAALLLAMGGTLALAQQPDEPSGNGGPFGTIDGENEGDNATPDSSSPSEEGAGETPKNLDAAPKLNLGAPRGEQDHIFAYQIRATAGQYIAIRFRVGDPTAGQVRPVRDTSVVILHNGQVVDQAETDIDGVAQIGGLSAGAYNIVANGPDGVAAFGFEVLPPVRGVSVPSYRLNALVVPGADYAASGLAGGATTHPPVGTPLPGSVGPAGNLAAPRVMPAIPVAAVQSSSDFLQPRSAPPAGGDPFGPAQVFSPIKGEPITLTAGSLGRGRFVIVGGGPGMALPWANATISVIQSGEIVGTLTTDAHGACNSLRLPEGVYSLVGTGSGGLVAVGIRVVATAVDGLSDTDEGKRADRQYVAALQGVPVRWVVGAASPSAAASLPGPGEIAGIAQPLAAPLAPGLVPGMGMGMGRGSAGIGGGGGFGGGGMLWGLLGAAGLGTGIAALVSEDDNDNGNNNGGGGNNRPPVSPYLPPAPRR